MSAAKVAKKIFRSKDSSSGVYRSSVRAGIDSSGHMFFDLSEKSTASAFLAQKARFSGIKISK